MRVLGLAFSGHGASACFVEDGRIVRAVNLERLTRVKFSIATLPCLFERARQATRWMRSTKPIPVHDFYEWFPQMLAYLTGEQTLTKAGIDLVVRYTDGIARLPGLEAEYAQFLKCFDGVRSHFEMEHHLCHAYQAYLCSPFDDAAVITIDGSGEPLERCEGLAISTSLAHGTGRRVEVLHEVGSLFSVGTLYYMVTRHLGFDHEQEGNTMALAAFGSDRWYKTIANTVRREVGGNYWFDYEHTGRFSIIERSMRELCEERPPGAPFTEEHKDLAWGCQAIAEDVLLHVARGVHARTGARRLAMAGGVALNCVGNARILRETPFEELYVMPNAGDRGLAAGAALYGYHVVLGGQERVPPLNDSLGRPLSRSEILADLKTIAGVKYRESADVAVETARLLRAGHVVGWVQGGAEFGPRALGHRSLLADPRTPASKRRLDAEIKKREWFRPYCPSVLAEQADDFFEMYGPSPYMLQAVRVRPECRERIAGVVHVDGTARVQTVSRDTEPLYYRLISAFSELTGIPMVLNTSLNGYGEPMVETARDATHALLSMGFDALAIGDFIVESTARPVGTPASEL